MQRLYTDGDLIAATSVQLAHLIAQRAIRAGQRSPESPRPLNGGSRVIPLEARGGRWWRRRSLAIAS